MPMLKMMLAFTVLLLSNFVAHARKIHAKQKFIFGGGTTDNKPAGTFVNRNFKARARLLQTTDGTRTNLCESKDGACGYCAHNAAGTCLDKGCKIVPDHGSCTKDTDCREGLKCDWGRWATSQAAYCQGYCARPCKNFNAADNAVLCNGQEALLYSRASYEFTFRYCCKDTTHKLSPTACSAPSKNVNREECDKSSECHRACNDLYYKSPLEHLPDAKWNDMTKQLKHFERHARDTRNLLNTGTAFGFTGQVGSKIVVVFKGTDPNRGDIAADADIQSEEFTTLKHKFTCHRGFANYYGALRQDVLTAVKKLMQAAVPTEILVTGHSLGGAMANLCAVDLADTYPDIKLTLTTFGAPRVFKGSNFLETQTGAFLSATTASRILTETPNSIHRFAINGDPIPSLLPEKANFVHIGAQLQLNEDKQNKHCSADHSDMAGSPTNHMGSTYADYMKQSCDASGSSRFVSHRLRGTARKESSASETSAHKELSKASVGGVPLPNGKLSVENPWTRRFEA